MPATADIEDQGVVCVKVGVPVESSVMGSAPLVVPGKRKNLLGLAIKPLVASVALAVVIFSGSAFTSGEPQISQHPPEILPVRWNPSSQRVLKSAVEYPLEVVKNSACTDQCLILGHGEWWGWNTEGASMKACGDLASEELSGWVLEPVPAMNVNGRHDVYALRKASDGDGGMYVAGNSQGPAFQSTNIDTTSMWIVTDGPMRDGYRLKLYAHPDKCLATTGCAHLFTWACNENSDQEWIFPDFSMSPGPLPDGAYREPTAKWVEVTSSNQDITYTLTTGSSFASGQVVTEEDTLGLSAEMEEGLSFEVPGFGGEESSVTVSSSLSHTYSLQVSQSSTTTETHSCAAVCKGLPDGKVGWALYQWQLQGMRKDGQKLAIQTCAFLCMYKHEYPQCPYSCCADKLCTRCSQGCLA